MGKKRPSIIFVLDGKSLGLCTVAQMLAASKFEFPSFHDYSLIMYSQKTTISWNVETAYIMHKILKYHTSTLFSPNITIRK